MINLPIGVTPQQFLVGFAFASVCGAAFVNVGAIAVKFAMRKLRQRREHRSRVRRLAELYDIKL
jgi:hypothetical protein